MLVACEVAPGYDDTRLTESEAVTREKVIDLMRQVSDLQNQVSMLRSRMTVYEQYQTSIEAFFEVTHVNGDTIVFDGVNLQLRNGLGRTDSTGNGLGNILVGYNELPYDADSEYCDRTGSHNVIVGRGHDYSGTSVVRMGDRP